VEIEQNLTLKLGRNPEKLKWKIDGKNKKKRMVLLLDE
jgi:ribosomal protein L24E